MEVAPRYWQAPETLKDIYVSTSGGTASGTETHQCRGRHRHRRRPNPRPRHQHATSGLQLLRCARNAANNALANTGKGSASSGAAVSTSQETMVPLAAFTHYGPATRRWR